MNQDNKASDENPELLSLLRCAPIRHLAVAIVGIVVFGAVVINYGPHVMPLGVAENLGASLYTAAAGLTFTLVLRLCGVYKRT